MTVSGSICCNFVAKSILFRNVFKSKIRSGSWVGSGCDESQYAGTDVTEKGFSERKSSSENKTAPRCRHPAGSAPPNLH